MTAQLYEGSPIGALSSALGGGLGAGQLGVVVSPAGVGKTALIVHMALDGLLRDEQVLHLAVRDTVDHARAHYDEVVRSVAQQRGDDWAQDAIRSERRRMILSYLDRRFDVAQVRQNLAMLEEVAHFRPKRLVLDGLDLDGLAKHAPALKALAEELQVPAWISVCQDGPLPESITAHVTLRLRMSPEGRSVRLSLLRGADDGVGEPLSVTLDPTTMLVQSGAESARSGGASPKASRCTLYSGGARGAEAAFGEAAERFGITEVNFTFDGHRQQRERGIKLLTGRELAAGDVSLVYVSRRLNRTYSNEGGLIRKVLQTLWHMVSRSQQVFVVGRIQDDGTVVGGTGWSVELARMWNKDLWVYDQDRSGWYRWDGNEWQPGTPAISGIHFAGTGTRYLSDDGKKAIDELFQRSFG